MLYGVLADAECRRNIFVGLTVNQSSNNLHFPTGQAQPCDLHLGCAGWLDNGCGRPWIHAIDFRMLGTPANRASFTNDVDKVRHHRAANPKPSLEDRINAFCQKLLSRAPRHDSMRSMS
jgi:hypothetical protein